MNIAKILKDCPKGTPLYSSVCGECFLYQVILGNDYPIITTVEQKQFAFTKEGLYLNSVKGECVIFPSKDNRDWSTFQVQKHYDFEPFDRVLVRDDDEESWRPQLFSYSYTDRDGNTVYVDLNNVGWRKCIPFEGNEELCIAENK